MKRYWVVLDGYIRATGSVEVDAESYEEALEKAEEAACDPSAWWAHDDPVKANNVKALYAEEVEPE